MSNAESQNGGQTPRQELKDRLAEQIPAWGIPHLLGIQHLGEMLGASRRRVNDSHKMQMQTLAKATGNEISEDAKHVAEDEDVAGINVQGDTTTTHNNTYVLPPEIVSAVTDAKSKSSLGKKLLPLVLTFALGGGAAAAVPLIYQWWQKPTPTPTVVLPDYSLRLEVKDKP